jgi:hypothetical protein
LLARLAKRIVLFVTKWPRVLPIYYACKCLGFLPRASYVMFLGPTLESKFKKKRVMETSLYLSRHTFLDKFESMDSA